jgi:hypothetical protein
MPLRQPLASTVTAVGARSFRWMVSPRRMNCSLIYYKNHRRMRRCAHPADSNESMNRSLRVRRFSGDDPDAVRLASTGNSPRSLPGDASG